MIIKSDRSLILISAIFMFLNIMFAFISEHCEYRVMGNAALGIAIYAPKKDSPEWKEKLFLRSKADYFFYLSILSGVLAIGSDIFVALRKNNFNQVKT